MTIADRKTGQDGKADCTLGFGSIWAVAEKDGLFAQALTVVSPEKKGQQVSLVLGEGAGSGEPEDFDFIAPDERCALCAIPLTAEQKRSRREVLDRCAALRAEWLAAAGEREAPPPRKALPLPFCGRESVPLTGGCSLTLTAPKVQNALWRQNYSLSKLDRGRFQVVRLKDIPAGGEEILSLPEGRYRLITTVRLPKGDQLARRWEFSLGPGKSRRIQLSFRQPALEDLLSSFSLPNFSLWDRSGGEIKSAALFQKTAYSLLCWLEPGREPTEHILNELREAGHGLAGCEINLVMEDWAGVGDFTCKRMLERFPKTEVWQGDFSDTAPALARSVFADPEKLPLILLVDRQGNCLYASSGYNVGTAELLVRLLHVLENT